MLGNETISNNTKIHALEDKNYSLTFVSDPRGVQTEVNRNLVIQVTPPEMQTVEEFQSSFLQLYTILVLNCPHQI